MERTPDSNLSELLHVVDRIIGLAAGLACASREHYVDGRWYLYVNSRTFIKFLDDKRLSSGTHAKEDYYLPTYLLVFAATLILRLVFGSFTE